MEDAGVLVVEALVVGDDLGEQLLVEGQVGDGGQEPTVACRDERDGQTETRDGQTDTRDGQAGTGDGQTGTVRRGREDGQLGTKGRLAPMTRKRWTASVLATAVHLFIQLRILTTR